MVRLFSAGERRYDVLRVNSLKSDTLFSAVSSSSSYGHDDTGHGIPVVEGGIRGFHHCDFAADCATSTMRCKPAGKWSARSNKIACTLQRSRRL
jgi:hypothetical protein